MQIFNDTSITPDNTSVTPDFQNTRQGFFKIRYPCSSVEGRGWGAKMYSKFITGAAFGHSCVLFDENFSLF